jgi:uncharacterized protein (TIGR00645 family)
MLRSRDKGSTMKPLERMITTILISSRWVLALFYLGLALSLLILLYKFGAAFFDLVRLLPEASEADIIVGVLGLVDVALVGSLVVIVIFSGYESFVGKLEGDAEPAWPAWMTKVDFSGVKLKLLGSIVAISAIQVLEAFMNLGKQPDAARLGWLVGIFMAFVGATLALALADRMSEGGKAE